MARTGHKTWASFCSFNLYQGWGTAMLLDCNSHHSLDQQPCKLGLIGSGSPTASRKPLVLCTRCISLVSCLSAEKLCLRWKAEEQHLYELIWFTLIDCNHTSKTEKTMDSNKMWTKKQGSNSTTHWVTMGQSLPDDLIYLTGLLWRYNWRGRETSMPLCPPSRKYKCNK